MAQAIRWFRVILGSFPKEELAGRLPPFAGKNNAVFIKSGRGVSGCIGRFDHPPQVDAGEAFVDTKAWNAALQRAGIDNFKWHDLRHTFATWHRQAGTPTHELQRLGGWKTAAMVDRYAHVAPEALQGAAARLDAFGGYAAATDKEKGPSA